MKIILIEILIVLAILIIRYAIRNKIRFFRGGYIVRRDSYMQDERMKILVEDTKFFRHKERNMRSIRVDGTNLVYSRIPLDPQNNALLVYSYCAPLVAMLKGTGVAPRRSLVLGGGGGAVPLYLLRNYEEIHTDIVEISEESIRTCKEYFLADYAGENGRAAFIHADAKQAVKTLEPAYQFIFCDLFVGGQPAEVVYDQTFMQDISRLCGDNGLLVINGGGFSMEGVRVVLKHLLAAFAQAWVMLLSDGFVVLARNTAMPALDNLMRHGQGIVALYPSLLTKEALEDEAADAAENPDEEQAEAK